MNNIYGRISQVAMAGAIAGVIQTGVIILCSDVGLFRLVGLPLEIPFKPPYFYQRFAWGALWGLLFLLPVLKETLHWKRGLVFALGPAAASLFVFLPFQDGHGMLGLDFGTAMPIVVVLFAMIWGSVAGAWLDRATGRVQPEAD